MKKAILAGLMALSAMGSVDANGLVEGIGGGILGGALFTGATGGFSRGRDTVVVRGERGDSDYVRQLERQNKRLRADFEELKDEFRAFKRQRR